MLAKTLLAAALAACGLLQSCATLFQSGPDAIPVHSEPAGARVLLAGQVVGTTPCTISVGRWSGGLVTIEKEGYSSSTHQLGKSFNATTLLNIFNYGIGFIVDGVAGNFTRYTGAVHVKLNPTGN